MISPHVLKEHVYCFTLPKKEIIITNYSLLINNLQNNDEAEVC
jgi:hypothetical protein